MIHSKFYWHCRLKDVYNARPVAICTDAASSCRRARDLVVAEGFNVLSFNCVAHQMNLVIQKVFAKERGIRSVFKSCCAIIKWVTSHRLPRHHLSEGTKQFLGQPLKLIQPAQTRWTTCIDAMCRLLQCKNALLVMALTHREDYRQMRSSKTEGVMSKLNNDFFEELKAALQLLVPFRVAIMRLESDAAHPGTVWEVHSTLFKHLNMAKHGPQGDCANAIYDVLRARWAARVG